MSDSENNEMMKLMRDWMMRREEQRKVRFARLRDEIAPALQARGVANVVMDYDGAGDSTDACSLTFLSADGQPVEDALPPEVDENEVIEILFCAVPDGYENNDGGFGQVILDVAAKTARSEHSQRYMETTYSEEEYPL